MKPFLKIDKRVNQLNDTDTIVYMILVYAKFKNKQISRAYIAHCIKTNSTESDYVTHCLRRIETLGLIKRTPTFKNAHCGGYITRVLDYELTYENYFMITLNLVEYDFDPKLKGFLLKLRTLCYDDSLKIKSEYNKTDIARYMGVSLSTLKRKLDALKALGCLTEENDPEPTYFIKRDALTRLSDNRLNELNTILLQASKESKLYKQAKWYYDNYIYLQSDANEIYDKMISGLLNK